MTRSLKPNKYTPWLILFFILVASPAFAALTDGVNNACRECGECSVCDILSVVYQIGKYIFAFMASIALILVIISGLALILSSGNQEIIASAKNFLKNAIIGSFIILAAWSLVNITLMVLSGNRPSDLIIKWWQGPTCDILICSDSIRPAVPAPPAIPPSSACVGLTMSGINPSQCADASSDLSALLSCIAVNKLAYPSLNNILITITSISDDDGFSNCQLNYDPCNSNDPAETGGSNCCDHMQNSCHYGGPSRLPASYAADIRSTGYSIIAETDFERLVENDCHGYMLVESDHYHISTPACLGR